MPRFRTEFRCVHCSIAMSDSVRMFSHGRCPACGFKDPDAGTIVKTTEHAYSLEYYGKWWQFWKVKRVYMDEALLRPEDVLETLRKPN